MGKMIECLIDSVRVSLTNQDRIIVLKDKESERYVPIWIGLFEAESITIALQNIAVARPLTHDLMLDMLHKIGARLLRIEITSLVTETYYANLIIQTDKEIAIDSRPSDALALVVRTGAPIFVDEEILDEVGIRPEESVDLNALEEGNDEELPGDLSVFEAFFDEIDNFDSQEPEDDSEDPEPDADLPEADPQ